jgi:hypothetical protein
MEGGVHSNLLEIDGCRDAEGILFERGKQSNRQHPTRAIRLSLARRHQWPLNTSVLIGNNSAWIRNSRA